MTTRGQILKRIEKLNSERRKKLAQIIAGDRNFHWHTFRSFVHLGLLEIYTEWADGFCIYSYSVPDLVRDVFLEWQSSKFANKKKK